jgi:choline dehydrogenase-like flavoprotein
MSSIGTIQALGMLATNATAPDFPDMEIYFKADLVNCAPGNIDALRSSGKRTMMVGPSYLHPKSRGRITLVSNDPFELPMIWANYLGESEDLDRMVDGVKMALAMLETEALSAYNFTFNDASVKACSNYEFKSDEYWACVVKQDNYALFHQGGTCKMGPASDPMAVVDPRLRVHGIKGLRVADTSIMPTVPSANTAPPAMMIGERVADFVKRDWNRETDQTTSSIYA